MKQFLTLAFVGISAMVTTPVIVAQEPTVDFIPTVQAKYFQQGWDSEKGESVDEVRIEVKFDEDVYWVSGFSQQCYLLDKDGNKYDGWYRDFSGPSSDYSAFHFGVRGLSRYVDADYTLVVPQGLLGNTAWYYDQGGKVNPELRYDFNAWKLAGCPRENFTTYDFNPVSSSYVLAEARINGVKQLELQLNLEFSDSVAVHKEFKNKTSLCDGEGNYLQDAVIRTVVDKDNPNKVMVGIRGVNLKGDFSYTINMWEGSFGTMEWAAQDYCESKASPTLEYKMTSAEASVMEIGAEGENGGAVYNILGIKVDPQNLTKGVYIKNGKKFIVK